MSYRKLPKGESAWCFALINGRLAEIYFIVGGGVKGIYAHCYVKRSEFNKRENREIDRDIKKHRLVYRNKKYKLKK